MWGTSNIQLMYAQVLSLATASLRKESSLRQVTNTENLEQIVFFFLLVIPFFIAH